MGLYIQHGWGKSDKIDRLAAEGLIDGVVLSPSGERPDALEATAAGIALPTFFDPQFFIYSITSADRERLGRYDLTVGDGTLQPATDFRPWVERLVTINTNLATQAVIAPAPIHEFSGEWAPVGFALSRMTIEIEAASASRLDREPRDVIGSLIVGEGGLTQTAEMMSWLNQATSRSAPEVSGYYVSVVRGEGGPYPRAFSQESLSALMILVWTLTRNGLDVIVGYSDVEGLLASAAGAVGFASGWSNRLRMLEEQPWRPSTGGTPPPRRVFSPTLLTPFRAEEATRASVRRYVPEEYRTAGTLAQAESQMSYLVGLGRISRELEAAGDDSRSRLAHLQDLIASALDNLLDATQDLVGAHNYSARLTAALNAIGEFSEFLERVDPQT